MRAGWLNFLSWVKPLAEFGPDWYPALKELTEAGRTIYAASIGARQGLLEWRNKA